MAKSFWKSAHPPPWSAGPGIALEIIRQAIVIARMGKITNSRYYHQETVLRGRDQGYYAIHITGNIPIV